MLMAVPGAGLRARRGILVDDRHIHCTVHLPGVQDIYTRLLSANLDFDSELQHVFCWEPDECCVSPVFHVDRVFLRLC